ENDLIHRRLHIVSANMHSVMNTLFAPFIFKEKAEKEGVFKVYEELSDEIAMDKRKTIEKEAMSRGMFYIEDESGTNINVQIFDTLKLNHFDPRFQVRDEQKAPVILVMDYAFGEQAYESMDELLKPYQVDKRETHLNVRSISIMGKAGILDGQKGDIMI